MRVSVAERMTEIVQIVEQMSAKAAAHTIDATKIVKIEGQMIAKIEIEEPTTDQLGVADQNVWMCVILLLDDAVANALRRRIISHDKGMFTNLGFACFCHYLEQSILSHTME